MSELSILYQDDFLVAVSKPSGMLVHRGMGAQADEVFLLQALRDQLSLILHPLHRLDRPTSGIVLFAQQSATTRAMQELWHSNQVRKTYHAIARGWMPTEQGLRDEALDHPLTGVIQDAQTRWRELKRCEVPWAAGPYPQSRYCLLELEPLTGRYHQLRRHLSRMTHPILGDTTHGDRHHNHAMQLHKGWWRLMLAAVQIQFPHPHTGELITIQDHEKHGVAPYWQELEAL